MHIARLTALLEILEKPARRRGSLTGEDHGIGVVSQLRIERCAVKESGVAQCGSQKKDTEPHDRPPLLTSVSGRPTGNCTVANICGRFDQWDSVLE